MWQGDNLNHLGQIIHHGFVFSSHLMPLNLGCTADTAATGGNGAYWNYSGNKSLKTNKQRKKHFSTDAVKSTWI